MGRFYGLHLMSVVYRALALIIAISSISAMGFVITSTLLDTEPAVSVSPLNLAGQVLSILIVGGLSSLTFYVLGQLIDVQLETLGGIRDLQQQFEKLDKVNTKQLQMLKPIADAKQQIQERTRQLRK